MQVHLKPIFLSVLIVLAAVIPAIADPGDPPSRVARLNYVAGSVSFQPAGADEWGPATLNRPLTIGDSLWTDRQARAELHIGSTSIRLGSETSFSFLDLDDQGVQVKLTQGLTHIRLREIDASEAFEVDTPNSAISLVAPGEYRFDVDPSGSRMLLTVRSGQAEVTDGDQAFTVYRGQQVRLLRNGSLSYDIVAAPGLDEFDQFCLARDRRADKLRATKYVSQEMTEYEDAAAAHPYGSRSSYARCCSRSTLRNSLRRLHAMNYS